MVDYACNGPEFLRSNQYLADHIERHKRASEAGRDGKDLFFTREIILFSVLHDTNIIFIASYLYWADLALDVRHF